MSGVFESIERFPVDYLPTGDRALVVAWVAHSEPSGSYATAILCLEDGRSKEATLEEFKFMYRYDNEHQKWVDVSGPIGEGSHADTDQEDADDGGASVP